MRKTTAKTAKTGKAKKTGSVKGKAKTVKRTKRG